MTEPGSTEHVLESAIRNQPSDRAPGYSPRTPVDVLFRDLDAIEKWTTDSQTGRFEVLVQNGYIAGAPTYLPVGELAICQRIFGALPHPAFPDALAASAAALWSGRASVSLTFAKSYASASDTACCAGMLVHAALCVGHARLAHRREWVLNEKRLLDRAGLADIQQLLACPGGTSAELTDTVEADQPRTRRPPPERPRVTPAADPRTAAFSEIRHSG